MTPEQHAKSIEIFTKLIEKYDSMRTFAREIREDIADCSRWRAGKKKLTTRAIVSICRLYPNIKPHDLHPDNFTDDVQLVFKTKKEK